MNLKIPKFKIIPLEVSISGSATNKQFVELKDKINREILEAFAIPQKLLEKEAAKKFMTINEHRKQWTHQTK